MFRFEGLDKSKHIYNPRLNVSKYISIDLTILIFIFIQSAFAKTSKNNINFNKYMVK